jgi:hypothetical protein
MALEPGQPVAIAFPRIASWWPDHKTPLTELAKLDYVVPSEQEPTSPDVDRNGLVRALNPAIALLADANACELKYRLPDAAGNPIGAREYDVERVGAVPTSWILTQVGSTLSASITTLSQPAQTISVGDSTKFRAGQLVLVDDEKCLVVSAASGTLSVRRGWAGSTAVPHAAGTRIAPAVSSWPYSVKVDLTDDCPRGRATGRFATPGTGTERARDWMVRRTAAHYAAAGWNGVAVDLGIGYLSWFKGTGAHQFRSIASRSNPDAEVDYAAFDAKWAASLRLFQTGLRAAVGPDAVILVNEATPEFDALNGSRLEGFPTKTTSSKTWYQRIIGPNKNCYYPSYLEWCQSARQPNFTTVETYGGSTTDYQLMRFGLTSALMGDGFYVFAVDNSPQLLRYDEYDNAGAGRGYLGAPIGPMHSVVTLSSPDIVGSGGFSDTSALNAWTLYPRSGYAATKSLDGAAAKIQVTQSAGAVDGVLFYRSGVAVSSGAHYTLTFRARADRDLSLRAQVQQTGSPYTTYMASDAVPLTTSWRTFEIPVTSSGTDAAAQLKFLLGKSAGTVWIDDVKLQAGDRNVYRRDFEGGVALVNATESAVTVDLGGTFRKIKGTQAPLVNDGTTVTSVTIQPKDGLVLLRTTAVQTFQTPDLIASYGQFIDSAALSAWTLYSRAGYGATKAIDAGTAKIQVTQSAGALGGVLFYLPNVSVTAGDPYTLSFRARSDTPLKVQAQVQQAISPYTSYMASHELTLTPTWQTFEIPVTSSGTDTAAQMKFIMGRTVGTVWIDDVML